MKQLQKSKNSNKIKAPIPTIMITTNFIPIHFVWRLIFCERKQKISTINATSASLRELNEFALFVCQYRERKIKKKITELDSRTDKSVSKSVNQL